MTVAEIVRAQREVPWGLIEFEQRPPDSRGREYRAYHVTADGKRRRVPSVTTILDVLGKRALLDWREKMGVRAAVAACREGILDGVEPEDAYDRLADIGRGAKDHMAAAAGRGTLIHDALERYATTEEPPNPADYPDELRGYVRGLIGWLLEAENRGLEVLAAERLVAHPTHGYAGRMDLRCRINGVTVIVDLKTNPKGAVYAEHHYQPAAYALADSACGEPPVHGGLIVAVGAEGNYTERKAVARPEDFLGVLAAYRAVSAVESAARNGKAA